jgi:hypothetical protein
VSEDPTTKIPAAATPLISAVSPADIAAILRQAGYAASVVDYSDFSQVQSSAQGVGFCIGFGRKALGVERKYIEFSFHCWLNIRGDLPPLLIDDWNQGKRYARLFRQEQTLALTMDVLVAGGVSEAYLRAQCELWERLLRELIVHMRKRRRRLLRPGGARGERRADRVPTAVHGTLITVEPKPKPGGEGLACLLGALLLLGAAGGLGAGSAHADPPAPEAQAKSPVCVDVHIGEDRSAYFNCLNAEMAQEVEQQAGRQAALQAAVDNTQFTAPSQINLFNETATKERLGPNFGHSPYPYRPVPVYHNPLLH